MYVVVRGSGQLSVGQLVLIALITTAFLSSLCVTKTPYLFLHV